MLTPIKPIEPCCDSCSSGCCNCTKEDIGLGNVDNTSDLNKPISEATQNALNGKVSLTTFNSLVNRVTALENESWDITDLTTRVGNLETLTNDMSGDLDSLSDRVGYIADDFTALANRMATAETSIGALEEEMPNNVKLTGRAEQTIVGKLKANDPSSGVTDKTLVTANWVSQSGNSSPNNLLHKIGDENFTGYKEVQNNSIGVYGSQTYGFICKSRWFASTMTAYNRSIPSFIFKGNDDVEIARLELVSNEGVFQIRARIKNHDNTEKIVVLARGDN